MKKVFIIAAILCMAFTNPIYATPDWDQVDLQVSYDQTNTQKGGIHKAPPRVPSVQIPVVFLDGNTLYFDIPCEGFTLQLVDEDDCVVYSVTIPDGITEW